MNKDRLVSLASLTVTVGGVCVAIYIFAKYIFFALLPFVIAWGAAFLIRPLAIGISTRIKIPRRIASASLTLLIVAIGLGLFSVICVYTVRWGIDFFTSLSENERFYEVLNKIMNPIGGLFGDREGAGQIEEGISDGIRGMIDSLLSSLLSLVTSFAIGIPDVLVFLLVTVTSAVYFSLELERVNSFVFGIIPERITEALRKFKARFTVAVGSYIRAYFTIMILTFVIMLVGFLLLGVKGAVAIAFLVSLLDALPLLGVGTVLVPWSVFRFISGDVGMGIGLILLFVIHELVRQFAEPRIVGNHLGIHPIISIMLLYLGYYFLGFLGLFAVPILTVIINALFGSGKMGNAVSDKDGAAEVD